MKQVDLHVHSTYSDGTNTPSELIAIASSKTLVPSPYRTTILLTEYQMPLKPLVISEVELIPGVELSTNFNNTEVHYT